MARRFSGRMSAEAADLRRWTLVWVVVVASFVTLVSLAGGLASAVAKSKNTKQFESALGSQNSAISQLASTQSASISRLECALEAQRKEMASMESTISHLELALTQRSEPALPPEGSLLLLDSCITSPIVRSLFPQCQGYLLGQPRRLLHSGAATRSRSGSRALGCSMYYDFHSLRAQQLQLENQRVGDVGAALVARGLLHNPNATIVCDGVFVIKTAQLRHRSASQDAISAIWVSPRLRRPLLLTGLWELSAWRR